SLLIWSPEVEKKLVLFPVPVSISAAAAVYAGKLKKAFATGLMPSPAAARLLFGMGFLVPGNRSWSAAILQTPDALNDPPPLVQSCPKLPPTSKRVNNSFQPAPPGRSRREP